MNTKKSTRFIQTKILYPSTQLTEADILNAVKCHSSQTPLDSEDAIRIFYSQEGQGVVIESVGAPIPAIPPVLDIVSSQDSRDRDCDHRDSSYTLCSPQLFALPDPGKPPKDQDNTSIWEAVTMVKQTKGTPNAPPTVAASVGARGTKDFEDFLTKLLGDELQTVIKYADHSSSAHFQNQGAAQVTGKYTPVFSAAQAEKFAQGLRNLLKTKPSESDLASHFIEKFFSSEKRFDAVVRDNKKMSLDQRAILRKTEYKTPFKGYDASEVRAGITAIRYICLAPSERLRGHTTTDTPSLLPAETDIRGRCDMVFGISEMCLKNMTGSAAAFVPCHDSSAGICCIWLRVEFKKTVDPHSVKAATHQWAVGAYISLQARLRLAPKDPSKSYLLASLSTSDFRQYGYILCESTVEIWEMRVQLNEPKQGNNRRETFYCAGTRFFTFPARKLTVCELVDQTGVENFCKWHSKIMHWGFEVYSRQYFDNVEHLMLHELHAEKWTLSHLEATGRDLPSDAEPEEGMLRPLIVLSLNISC